MFNKWKIFKLWTSRNLELGTPLISSLTRLLEHYYNEGIQEKRFGKNELMSGSSNRLSKGIL